MLAVNKVYTWHVYRLTDNHVLDNICTIERGTKLSVCTFALGIAGLYILLTV
jgi:hypothetical protein